MTNSEFSGRCTVVEVSAQTVILCPMDGMLGGTCMEVPVAELPGASIGDVIDVQILWDGEVWLVEFQRIGRALRVSVRKTRDGWQGGSGKDRFVVPFVESLTESQRDQLGGCPFWRVVEGPGGPGHFEDASGFLARRADEREKAQRQADEAREQALLKAWPDTRRFVADKFVNPFNFVPLPEGPPDRREPVGHERRHPGLLHGSIDVTAVAQTPLLLRDSGQRDGAGKSSTTLPRRGNRVVVPGSSVKGSIRSAFEAITGSCMRVIDGDFMPGYRDVLRAQNKSGWSLVEIDEVDRSGRPTRARMCTDTIWVVLDVLQGVLGEGGVRTGARFRLVGTPKTIGERAEVRHRDQVAAVGDERGSEYVLLVTDVRARPPKKAVTFAAGRVAAEAIDVRVDDAAWSRFEAASDGATDNKRGTKDPQDEIAVPIRTDKSLGRAVRQRQGLTTVGRVGLRAGHVLWARTERSSAGVVITELSFAQTWRHAARGDHPHVSDRLPAAYLPCTGIDGLCPACRVFGSAHTGGGRRGADRPYRGHVRFTDWSVTGDVETIDLAPMGQPRPGSGQLYLQHDAQPSGEAARADIGQDPLREWGSALDQGSPRPIRGRKMYWRAEDAGGRPARYKFHKSHAGKESAGSMAARAEVVRAGATVSGRLMFENLRPGELGAILVALSPGLIKDHQHPGRGGQDGTFCFTLGGGKPLGLGATHVTQVEVTLDLDRYTSRAQARGSVDEFAAAFVAEQPPEVRAVWADFLELVRLNAVDPALLSYPRDAQWPEQGDSADLYGPGFQWWKSSAGMPWDGLGSKYDEVREAHGYAVMPTATAPDPRLPITIEGVAAPDHVKARLTMHATKGRR